MPLSQNGNKNVYTLVQKVPNVHLMNYPPNHGMGNMPHGVTRTWSRPYRPRKCSPLMLLTPKGVAQHTARYNHDDPPPQPIVIADTHNVLWNMALGVGCPVLCHVQDMQLTHLTPGHFQVLPSNILLPPVRQSR